MKYKIYLILGLLIISINSSWGSEKKGIGMVSSKHEDVSNFRKNQIDSLNVSWYYTWGANPITGVTKEFVPMIWGGKTENIDRAVTILQAKKKVPFLLVINEPDLVEQANMSVDEVVRLWPKLSSLADKISSPVPAGGPMNSWFKRFFKIVQNRNLKMDFIAVHSYPKADEAEKFLQGLDEIYQEYHKPIWITEFAVADWDAGEKKCKIKCISKYSEEEVLVFMQKVLPVLEKRSYIARYAWFMSTGSKFSGPLGTSRLFDNDGNLTKLGQFYANFQ